MREGLGRTHGQAIDPVVRGGRRGSGTEVQPHSAGTVARLLARPSLLPPDTMRATAARTGGAATCGWQQGEVRGDTREKARAADQTDDCLCTPFERAGGALATLLLGRRPARCWRGRGVLWTRADHQSGCLIGCTPLMPNCTEFILTSAPLAIVLPHRVSSRDAALHLEGWWRASK